MSGQEQAPAFSIQRVYLKGMSLEMPNAPAIFLESQQPSVEVAVDVSSLTIVEGIHETAVTVTLTTRVGDKVAFLIETTQAGIFEIRNVPADQMDVLVNVVCANIVFPYLRANLADAIQRTGFPPIHLADLDFGAIHQQRLEQQGAAAPSGLIVPGRA
ncbi:MAG: protein-export chaperone SecB [Burkholderiaceae bacterium]|jgi:preprotein translocase subunit SecB|nr:protein-export chaperone SecB [Betaproteobacteria bacterium]